MSTPPSDPDPDLFPGRSSTPEPITSAATTVNDGEDHPAEEAGSEGQETDPRSEIVEETPEASIADAQSPRSSSLRWTLEWALIVAGALLVALVIKATLIQAFYIPSESMVPTLKVSDRVLVNKLSYRLHDVHRGDIVVFERPEGEDAPDIKDLIKRVIGLPGDMIEARDGQVLVNGRILREPYLPEGGVTFNLPPQRVPPDHYFVMGDNRSNSRDSRVFHAIPRSLIVGRAFVRIWPPSDLGAL